MKNHSSVPGTLALLAITAVIGCDSSETDTSAIGSSLDNLCRKAAECEGVKLGPGDLRACRSAIGTLGSVLVDPESFDACLGELSCAELADETAIQRCLDLDPTTIHCGEDDLLACTNAGVCSQIDCGTVCSLIQGTYSHCGASPEFGYDVCWCEA